MQAVHTDLITYGIIDPNLSRYRRSGALFYLFLVACMAKKVFTSDFRPLNLNCHNLSTPRNVRSHPCKSERGTPDWVLQPFLAIRIKRGSDR